jgi:predicted acetyltransferase
MAARLVPVSRERKDEFLEMMAEWRASGNITEAFEPMWAIALGDVDGYFDLVEGMRASRGPFPDMVKSDTFWIEEDGRIRGTVSIRYALNQRLAQRGGHIGYSVRPSARGHGVATRGLELALEVLRAQGVDEALLTCNDSNAASARIIEKCGGRRSEDSRLDDGSIVRRYWVPTKREATT